MAQLRQDFQKIRDKGAEIIVAGPEDVFPYGHPLAAERFDHALIPKAVPVLQPSAYQISDRFNTAVWVPWKSLCVIIRVFRIKEIQQ